MTVQTVLHRGPARYEVIERKVRTGRYQTGFEMAMLETETGAESVHVLTSEPIPDERPTPRWQRVTFLLFWRSDAEPT